MIKLTKINWTKTMFVVVALCVGMALSVACDNGGENNDIDQDVKEWCEQWIYCLDSGKSSCVYVPYKTVEECYPVRQWLKDHKNDKEVYLNCWITLSDEQLNEYGCEVACGTWAPIQYCSYTPWGACPTGDPEQDTCE